MQPVFDPAYWSERLFRYKKHPKTVYKSVYLCGQERWDLVESRHRVILAGSIHPHESVLDAGCGYGRLLSLMPKGWKGQYLGVDICPEFIQEARSRHKRRDFLCADLRTLDLLGRRFDWAILISIRGMVLRNVGEAEWERMRSNLRSMADRLLILEYDTDGVGTIEEK